MSVEDTVSEKRKRVTKAEMGNRNKAIAMAAALLQVKYDRLPTVHEISVETKYDHQQIYDSAPYKEGKIAKKSAKKTTELIGSSTTGSEQFNGKSNERSRIDKRTKSEQAELDALIDQQK